MPVFDFNNTPDTKEPVKCTYTTFASDADHASAEQPILILDNSKKEWIIPVVCLLIRISRLHLNLMRKAEK